MSILVCLFLPACSTEQKRDTGSDAFSYVVELIYENNTVLNRSTAFFVGKHTLITVAHSMDEAYESGNILFRFHNGDTTYAASVIRRDTDLDLCILSTAYVAIGHMTVTPYDEYYGEDVTILGNNGGFGLGIIKGCVSIPTREITTDGATVKRIQLSLSAEKGVSGAPVFSASGALIGILSKQYKESAVFFAIPNQTVRDFLKDLL